MAMLAYDTFHGLEHIFDYLDVVDLVHSERTCKFWLQCIQSQNPSAWVRLCQVKWRWWKIPHYELSHDFSGLRAFSDETRSGRLPLPSPTSGLPQLAFPRDSSGTPMRAGPAESPIRSGHPFEPLTSPKRMTLGRIHSTMFPVPLSYSGSKAEFVRRTRLDSDVKVLFRMLQCPMFYAIASKHLSDVGFEGRDQLDKLATVDLTHQYYYSAVIRDINEGNMIRHFKEMVTHDDAFEVEDGLILVAKWANPLLDVDHLRSELKGICVSVRDALAAAGHIVYDPRDNSIAFCSGSMLPALDCISKTLFDVMDFKGNQQDYYDPKNSYLDEVVSRKLGLPITLSVLYAVVCREVNIPIDMIGMPAKFLVKYAAPPSSRDPETFIDPFEGGRFLSRTELQDILLHIVPDPTNPEYLRSIRNRDVWARVIRNLINVFKERVLLPELCGAISLLFCVDGPDALAHRTLRLQTCQLMDPPRLGTVLEDVAFLRQLQSNGTLPAQINALLEAFSTKFAEIQTTYNDHLVAFQSAFVAMRADESTPLPSPAARLIHWRTRLLPAVNIAFRIGQCVFHRLHQYRAVIVGWDSECQASEKWIETMQVHRLPRGRTQPFYKLLVDCRDRPQSQQLAYVAEENIGELPAFSDEIQHSEVGRYFCTRFPGPPVAYNPNAWLSAQYPEDGVIAAASTSDAVEVDERM